MIIIMKIEQIIVARRSATQRWQTKLSRYCPRSRPEKLSSTHCKQAHARPLACAQSNCSSSTLSATLSHRGAALFRFGRDTTWHDLRTALKLQPPAAPTSRWLQTRTRQLVRRPIHPMPRLGIKACAHTSCALMSNTVWTLAWSYRGLYRVTPATISL